MSNLFAPNSVISLCQVPLENDYKHQLKFKTLDDQKTYFNSKVIRNFVDFSYIRADNSIKVSGDIDEFLNINYCFYMNKNYSNKIFYAFVNRVEYVSETVTKLYLEIDVFQTYQFELTFNQSFIKREHVNDDSIGSNTVPESLEHGEYIIQASFKDANLLAKSIVMASTVTPFELADYYGGVYNGIYSGVRYYAYKHNQVEALRSDLSNIVGNGKGDAVTGLFYAPDFLAVNQGGVITESTSVQSYDHIISRIGSIEDYIPKNKKLLTYPYIAIVLSNGNGGSAIYHQEQFAKESVEEFLNFRVIGALTVGCSIRCYPRKYKGADDPIDEGLNLGKFPSCNWATDQFTNWMTQNAVNIGINALGSAGQIVGGALMLSNPATSWAGAGAIAGGLSGIASTLNEVHKASLVPPQASGNLNAGDVIMSSNNNAFNFFKMTIKKEYAKIIDEFFTMFGYKINRVKTPNLSGRSNFNYIKMIDANIDGNIPQEYLIKIRQIFNQGITLWHDPSKMYRYDLDNDIIS